MRRQMFPSRAPTTEQQLVALVNSLQSEIVDLRERMHQFNSQPITTGLPSAQPTRREGPDLEPAGERDEEGAQVEVTPIGESRVQLLQDKQLPQRQERCEAVSSVSQAPNDECITANVEMLRAWRERNPDLWPGELHDDDYNVWLLAAATNGDAAAVQAVLNAGANVDSADYFDDSRYGITPLYAASQHGHEAVVKVLLHAGANVDNTQVIGHAPTPLHAAVIKGNEAIVRALLDAGADLNRRFCRKDELECKDLPTQAPLDPSLFVDDEEEGGGEEEETDEEEKVKDAPERVLQRYTALYVAVEHGHETLVRMLLDEGAELEYSFVSSTFKTRIGRRNRFGERDLRARLVGGSMLLSKAMANGQEAVLQMLLDEGVEKAEVDNERGRSMLLAKAVAYGHTTLGRMLKDKEKKLDFKKENGSMESRVLWEASRARNDYEALLRLLWDKGAKTEERQATVKRGLTVLLQQAVRNDQASFVRLLLHAGATVDSASLQHAVEHQCQMGTLQLLLNAGATVNPASLMHAVEEGQVEVVRLLLKAVMTVTSTSLRHAVEKGQEKVVRDVALLRAGGERKHTLSAWEGAVDRGKLEVARLLLKPVAEVNSTALVEMAVSSGHTTLLRLLLQAKIHTTRLELKYNSHQSERERSSWWSSALCTAVSHREKAMVQIILDAGAQLPVCDVALCCAASNGDESMVHMLLDYGVNSSDTRLRRHISPSLCAAAKKGDEAMVRILLDTGASFDDSSLFAAAHHGYEVIVQILLKAGPKFDDASLCAAAEHGYEAIVQILLDAGVKPNDASLCAAAKHSHTVVVRILLDARAHYGALALYNALCSAVSNGDDSVVRMLLDAGADTNSSGSSTTPLYKTPLVNATNNGHESLVQMLLEAGAHANAKRSICEDTALHCAAYHGHLAVVNLLLEAGADVDVDSHRAGCTRRCPSVDHSDPLSLSGTDGSFAIIRKPVTPLSYAVEHGHKTVVDLLLKWGADVNKPKFAIFVPECRGSIYGSWDTIITTLGFAAKNRHLSVMCSLLEAGVIVANMEDVPHIKECLHSCQPDQHEDVLERLMKAGLHLGGGVFKADAAALQSWYKALFSDLGEHEDFLVYPGVEFHKASHCTDREAGAPAAGQGADAEDRDGSSSSDDGNDSDSVTQKKVGEDDSSGDDDDDNDSDSTSIQHRIARGDVLQVQRIDLSNHILILGASREHSRCVDLKLPPLFGGFQTLEHLNLENCRLTNVHVSSDKLRGLIALKVVSLSYNRLTALPAYFGTFIHLQELRLDSNALTWLPDELGALSRLKRLFIGRNRLESVPKTIGSLTGLTKLELSQNNLKCLPAEFNGLSALKKLNLHVNMLTDFKVEPGSFKSLIVLSLGGNKLSNLPTELCGLTALKRLYLNDNQLRTLPVRIGELIKLETLHLHNNLLTGLEVGGGFAKLSELNLAGNNLTSLPATIGELASLKMLNLNRNRLSIIPSQIAQLANLDSLLLNCNNFSILPIDLNLPTSLVWLDLASNSFTSVPTCVKDLHKLNALGLRNNLLHTVPDWLGGLADLVNLNLMDNQLTSLPVTLGRLFEEGIMTTDDDIAFAVDNMEQMKWLESFANSGDDTDLLKAWRVECGMLREFWLESEPVTTWEGLEFRHNGGDTQVARVTKIDLSRYVTGGRGVRTTIILPKYIGRLDKLEYMCLDKKNLTSVPEELGDLRSLNYMSLCLNYLTALPIELGRLSVLKELHLGCNLLESVPEELGGLYALEVLFLNNNKLTSIPVRLGELRSLKVLHLNGNKLTSVPADLGRLTALKTLYIDDNKLESLPTEFGELCKLQTLILNDNELTSVPMELGMLTALRLLNLLENSPLRTLPTAVMDMRCKLPWPFEPKLPWPFEHHVSRYDKHPSKASMGMKCKVLW